MGRHPGGASNAKKRKRISHFPGLNPELAASDDGGNGRWNPRRGDTEMAAELAVPDAKSRKRRRARAEGRASGAGEASDAGRATGLFALALAVASLFIWALPLGLTAAVLGWYSFREGARGLGVWAVVIGLAAALSQLVLIPIQAAW